MAGYMAIVVTNDLAYRTKFLDLPALHSVGKTVDEALQNAKIDLAVYAHRMREFGVEMPKPGACFRMGEHYVEAVAIFEVPQ